VKARHRHEPVVGSKVDCHRRQLRPEGPNRHSRIARRADAVGAEDRKRIAVETACDGVDRRG
jgi:hypothetical protein